MTTKCDHCPIADSPCVARMCGKAARGVASDLAQIRAINASQAGRVEPKHPAQAIASQSARPTKAAVNLVPLALAKAAQRLGGRNCPESKPAACGCSGLVYCNRLGRDASIRDCTNCERIKELS